MLKCLVMLSRIPIYPAVPLFDLTRPTNRRRFTAMGIFLFIKAVPESDASRLLENPKDYLKLPRSEHRDYWKAKGVDHTCEHDMDKSWDEIYYLLTDLPIDNRVDEPLPQHYLLYGGEEVSEDVPGTYTRPRFLNAEQVKGFLSHLQSINHQQLEAKYQDQDTRRKMQKLGLGPLEQSASDWDYISLHYGVLMDFLQNIVGQGITGVVLYVG